MPRKKLDDPHLQDRLLDLIRAGHGRYEAAHLVGLTHETYRKYYRDNPEFRAAVEAAVDTSVEPVIKMLRDEGLAGDITAAKEYLKHTAPAPRGEKQKIEVEHTHQLDPATISTIEELRARLDGRAPTPELEDPNIVEGEVVDDADS